MKYAFVGLLVVALGLMAIVLLRPNAVTPTNTVRSVEQTLPTTTMTDDEQLAKLVAAPTATVTTSLGTFTMRFYSADAPELSKNFIELAKRGSYDGLTFHRVMSGFVIQGGDPSGDGTGGASYTGQGLADEAGALALRHLQGSVAWAKSSQPNSIGSQFYVALNPLPDLDGGYSVFGQVVDGQDVVDAIGAVETDANERPVTPVTIESITINE
ncbi:MAG: peptidylprolyl isomerase [Candidatus Kerfeldbacteria bacterium]|nr:peptidylprolyl isomerase [Candidatus Kerfeldbacteria bacterium]